MKPLYQILYRYNFNIQLDTNIQIQTHPIQLSHIHTDYKEGNFNRGYTNYNRRNTERVGRDQGENRERGRQGGEQGGNRERPEGFQKRPYRPEKLGLHQLIIRWYPSSGGLIVYSETCFNDHLSNQTTLPMWTPILSSLHKDRDFNYKTPCNADYDH